jgi:MoaA/NifB/PqqE/SkfB family radical SAM enzyme
MPFVFNDAPKRIYWELTRACDLACSHCRADANPCADPRELHTTEVFRILTSRGRGQAARRVHRGDPLKRRDFFDIVEHAAAVGLPVNVSPSATPLLTSDVIQTLAAMRVAAMSLSLDGSSAARHDSLRGVVGTYSRTVQLAREIVRTSIALQVNTLVTTQTVDDLPEIHRVVREIGADRWSLFFLITTGRGKSLGQLTPAESETVLNWALDRVAERRPIVTTTEAPHYRRLAVMRHAENRERTPGRPLVQGLGMRDGNGVMFISHTGEVQPSGFLPLTAGYARTENPLQIYRESPLFQDLRKTECFTGRRLLRVP